MNRRELIKSGGLIAAMGVLHSSSAFAQTKTAGTSSSTALKIRTIEAFILRSPHDNQPEPVVMPPVGEVRTGVGLWRRVDFAPPSRSKQYSQTVLVKVTTQEGIVGWGESHAPASPRVQRETITDLFAPTLIGEDARNVEVLWERMYSSQRMRGYGTGSYAEAIAGIDMALWDILGKSVGLPVYQLLGGKYRNTIPTYLWIRGQSPAEIKDSVASALAAGYSVVKMGLKGGPGTTDFANTVAASEAMGSRGQVIVDSLGSWKLYEATEIGREFDRLKNIGWWEDPLLPEDDLGYQKLTDALTTPICKGEVLSNRFQARDLFEKKAVDISNIDLARAGGITECKRISIIADVYGIMWTPHVSMGSVPYFSSSIHLAAATPNFLIMEHSNQDRGAFGNRLLKQPLVYRGGYAEIPERPGLGIEIDEVELRKLIVS